MDCLFCTIIARTIPSEILHEDELCLVFRDISPCAPSHLLIIPKRHISTLNDLEDCDQALMGHLILIGAKIAKQEKLSEKGFRFVINCNEDGGQSVFHLHLHLLGGRALQWPPG